MKRIFLTIMLLSISFANAQMKVTKIDSSNVIEVGKISPMGTSHAVIEKHSDY